MKHIFYIEVTDTFGGECNYCWIRRYAVKAKTLRGAMRVVGKHEMLSFSFDGLMYHAKGACIAAYDADPDSYITADEAEKFVSLNF